MVSTAVFTVYWQGRKESLSSHCCEGVENLCFPALCSKGSEDQSMRSTGLLEEVLGESSYENMSSDW